MYVLVKETYDNLTKLKNVGIQIQMINEIVNNRFTAVH